MLFKLRLFNKNVCKMYKNIDKYKVKDNSVMQNDGIGVE